MSNNLSITRWIVELRDGNSEAAEPLFREYFDRLVRLARSQLASSMRRAADEEDVALSAMNSFFRGAANGRFPQLQNRHDLWRLLFSLTLYKSRDAANRERRQRRGGDRVVTATDLFELLNEVDGLDCLTSPEPPPDLVISFAEQVNERLAKLPGDDLRRGAMARLEGDTVAEAAQRLGTSQRAIERKLRLIREIWQSDS